MNDFAQANRAGVSSNYQLSKIFMRFLTPYHSFDSIVIKRLLALEQADIEMKDRVKTTLEQVYNQQSEDFVSIPQQAESDRRSGNDAPVPAKW